MTITPAFPNDFTDAQLAAAMCPANVPTFAELTERIECDETLTSVRRRDMLSALRRVPKALGMPPEHIVAHPPWLQPRLNDVAPAAFGMSRKTWSNLVSNLNAAFKHLGVVERRNRRKEDLSPRWRPLYDKVLESKDLTLRSSLCRFVHFVDQLAVSPEAVCEAHFEAYAAALTATSLRRPPQKSLDNALFAWNAAVDRVPGWPGRKLVRPSRAKRIKLPIEAFPPTFAAHLEAWIEEQRRRDPLSDGPRRRVLSQATLDTYRSELLRFAGRVVGAGVCPDEIVDLHALLTADRVEQGLRAMLADADDVSERTLAYTARTLLSVGLRLPDLPSGDLEALSRFEYRLRPKNQTKAMSSKARERLRPFRDPETLQRFLELPEDLMRRAGDDRRQAACLLRKEAIAIALLTYCPVRRKNLVAINLERHVIRPGDGRGYLVCEPGEVKNGERIEFELPPHLLKMIDVHLATRSPSLCPAGTPWLFPRRDGAHHINSSDAYNFLVGRVRRELGLTVNPHLYRHLATMLWLDEHPGGYEGAKRLLAHSRLSTTINLYSGLESLTVGKAFGDLIAERRNR